MLNLPHQRQQTNPPLLRMTSVSLLLALPATELLPPQVGGVRWAKGVAMQRGGVAKERRGGGRKLRWKA